VAHAFLQPNGVLGNKLGISDGEKLNQVERELTEARKFDVDRVTQGMPFNYERLQTIHKTLFQDVYDWAGKERLTNLYKQGVEFTPLAQLPKEKIELFKALEEKNNLKGLSRDRFADAAADVLSALNKLHPFPEGNGRTQRIFMEQLAKEAGHEVDFSVVTRFRNIETSIDATLGDKEPMRRLFREITDPERVKDLKAALQEVQRLGHNPNEFYVSTTVPNRVYSGRMINAVDAERVLFQDTNSKDLVITRSSNFSKIPNAGDEFTLKTPAPRARDVGQNLGR
jgi:cell filamentation protein